MPRSLVSIFRCSFGDCDSKSGTPLLPHFYNEYGFPYVLLFLLFLFVWFVGLFNVISAIFVEATMKTAADLKHERKEERLESFDVWAANVQTRCFE